MKTMSWRFLTIGLVWLAVLLGGCSSSSDSPVVQSGPAHNVSGTASLGLISNGTVSIFKINSAGEKSSLLASGETDAHGAYSITVHHSGPVLVEVTGGTYVDEATGETIDLEDGFVLRAALPAVDGDVEVAVTPLTELAVRMAEKNGLTAEKIDAANDLLSQLIDADIITTQPADPEDDVAFGEASEGARNYALMLASFSQVVADSEGVDVVDLFAAMEEDLADMTLDVTGAALANALTNFLVNPNNDTGVTDSGTLGDQLDTIVAGGFEATGNLADAKQLLSDFLIDGDEADYLAFMNYMDDFMATSMSVAESQEAHLFHALATLMYTYNHDSFESMKTLTGLNLDNLDPTFDEFLMDPAQQTALIEFVADEGALVLLDEFAALELTLDAVEDDLAEANGIKTSISMTELGTTYLDSIDVRVLTMMTQAMKAQCIFMQSLDLTITDWDVTPEGGGAPVDARTMLEAGGHWSLTDAQKDEVLDNNPDFLTYADTTRLPDFKLTVKALRDELQAAVTAFDDLGADGRRMRYRNAFGLDSDKGLWDAKGALESMQSFVTAMDNPATPLKNMNGERTATAIIVADDGFSYQQHTYNFYRYYRDPAGTISISDFVNGLASPRTLLDELNENPLLELYVERDGAELVRAGVTETEWDNPM